MYPPFKQIKYQTKGLSHSKVLLQSGQPTFDLDLAKKYMLIPTSDYDTLLNSLVKTAIYNIEKYAWISIYKYNVTAQWEALATKEPLPYCPCTSNTFTVTDRDNNTLTPEIDYRIEGLDYKYINPLLPLQNCIKLTYQTGYDIIPEDLFLAITKHVLDDFQMRQGVIIQTGRQNGQSQILPNNWKSIADKYKRRTWIL